MAKYKIKRSYPDRDKISEHDAETVGMAVIEACHGDAKPDFVSAAVLMRRPGSESWVPCYVSAAILGLL